MGRAVVAQGVRAEIARLEYQIARQTLENLELGERIESNQVNIEASRVAIADAQTQLHTLDEEQP